jgi:hypothetical protein
MKKINFKKAMAAVAALSLVACVSAVPASASGTVTLSIDQVELSLEEVQAMDYLVPVYANLTQDGTEGLNAVEFGIDVPDCDFTVYTNRKQAQKVFADANIDWSMTMKTNDTLTWLTWASATADAEDNTVALVAVKIPEDAQPGDIYYVNYVAQGDSPNIWRTAVDEDGVKLSEVVNYVADGSFSGVGGWVKIKDEETTATTETTTETTTESTTESTTEATTESTTEAATDATTTTTTAAATTTGESTTAGGTTTTAKSTTTASSSSSPKTGATDVLPIAGVAAAVAVLGGVAMVAKKKKD